MERHRLSQLPLPLLLQMLKLDANFPCNWDGGIWSGLETPCLDSKPNLGQGRMILMVA